MRIQNSLPLLLVVVSAALFSCDSSEKSDSQVEILDRKKNPVGKQPGSQDNGGRPGRPTDSSANPRENEKGQGVGANDPEQETSTAKTTRELWETPGRPASQADEMFLLATDDAGRIAVIEEKQTSGPEDLAPILRRALLTSSPEVRVGAVMATGVLPTKEKIDILSGAVTDENVAVRNAAIERSKESPEIMEEVFEEVVEKSEHDDTRELVFREMAFRPTKQTIEMLIAGLGDESAEIRRVANHSIRRDLQQDFATAEEGLRWWGANQDNFDNHLQRVR